MEAGITMREVLYSDWKPYGIPLEPEFGRFKNYLENFELFWPDAKCFGEKD
jgi:hypothetical protein